MIFILILISQMAVAWESDSFTCRYQELQDSTVPLSAEVNRRMAEVVTVGTPTNRKESHIQIQQRILEVGYAGLSDQDRTIVDVEVRDFMSARNISDFNEGVRRWSSSPGRPQPLSGCDRTELLAALRGTLASPFTGTIGTWAEGSPSISKCLPEGVGIYRGFRRSTRLRSLLSGCRLPFGWATPISGLTKWSTL